MFGSSDVDKDGFLSMKELKQLLISLEINIDINLFFAKIDLNNDGKLDLQEFV